jgi:SnoaL-like domain
VKGALARARTALRAADGSGGRPRDPGTEQAVARRFAEAFAADDIDAVVALLTDDAWLAMPPAPHAYHGRAAVAAFLRASADARGRRGLRLVPTGANRQPAFACYLADARPAGLMVLTVAGDRIGALTRFLGPGLLDRFDLVSIVD